MIQTPQHFGQYNQQEDLQKNQKPNQRSSILFQSTHQHEANNDINYKIEAMKNSINQMSILSGGKPLQNLNKIETQLIFHKDQVHNNQKKCLNELASLQKTLLSLQKQRFWKQVAIKNQKQSLDQQLDDLQQNIVKYNDKITAKISQFRDKMTDIKIQMVQLDAKCRQKSQKTKQKYIQQVMIKDKQISNLNKNEKITFKDKLKVKCKQLNMNIEQQHNKILKQRRKYKSIIEELKISINNKMDQQQYRQKEGFQHNYDALQEIFTLLALQTHQK